MSEHPPIVEPAFRLRRRLLQAATLLSLHSFASAALACSCAWSDVGGFRSGPRLPVDARGVLFEQVKPDGLLYARHGMILKSMPEPLSADDFVIHEIGSGRRVPARIVPLRALTQPGGFRYYRLLGEQLKGCFDGTNARTDQCPPVSVREAVDKDPWLREQVERETVIDVTEQAVQAAGLFRVEPEHGFRPGTDYVFEYRGVRQGSERDFQPLYVHIDDHPLAQPVASMVRLVADGAAAQGFIQLPWPSSCSNAIPASSQRIAFKTDAAAEPYLDTLLFFTEISADGRSFNPWQYRASACSQIPLGGTGLGHGKELVYRSCDQAQATDQATTASIQVKARLGFLEIEDALAESNTLALQLPLPSPAWCRAWSVGTPVDAEPDLEALAFRCDAWKVFQLSYNDRIEQNLLQLTGNDEAIVRKCAVSTLGGHVYGEAALADPLRADAIARLVAAVTDPDLATRRAAIDWLRKLRWWNRWATDIPADVTDRLWQALVLRLKDDDREDRVEAARVLAQLTAHLPQSGRLRNEPLIAAARDGTHPNEAIPGVLEWWAGRDRALLQALLDSLVDADAKVRDAAAQALSGIARTAPATLAAADVVEQLRRLAGHGNVVAVNLLGTTGPVAAPTVPALIEQARRGDRSAARSLGEMGPAAAAAVPVLLAQAKQSQRESVVALGQIGAAAKTAVPFLLELATASRWPVDRSNAMVALVQIAPLHPRVRPTWQGALRRSASDSVEQRTATSILNVLGPAAMPVLPDVLEILDGRIGNADLSNYEFRAYVNALARMQAPRKARIARLLRALTATSESVRTEAVDALLELGPIDERLLLQLLTDADERVRWRMVDYLASGEQPIRDRPGLVEALSDVLDRGRDPSKLDDVLRAAQRLQIRDATLCGAVRRWSERDNTAFAFATAAQQASVCPSTASETGQAEQ